MSVGSVKAGGGMTFIEVDSAGHMVPLDQPKVVRQGKIFLISPK